MEVQIVRNKENRISDQDQPDSSHQINREYKDRLFCKVFEDKKDLLELYNEHSFTGGGFIAPMALSAVPEEKWPSACIGCRSCEKVCPQQIKISEAMADFAAKLKG